MSSIESGSTPSEAPQEPRLDGLAYGPDGNLLPQHVDAKLRYLYKLPEFIVGKITQYTPDERPDDTNL